MGTSGYIPTSSDPLLPPKTAVARAVEDGELGYNGFTAFENVSLTRGVKPRNIMAAWVFTALVAWAIWSSGKPAATSAASKSMPLTVSPV